MTQMRTAELQDFTGGLNYRADQFQLKDNESPLMVNVDIDPRGGVFSRGGYQRINTTDVAGTWTPQRLTPFYGDTANVMLTTLTKVYQSTGANFSLLQYTGSVDITSTATWGAALAQWGKTLYIATGPSGAGYKWLTADTLATTLTASGPTWQAYVSPVGGHQPLCQHLTVHASKMFAANTNEDGVAHPNRLRWSHENSPENWLEADYIDLQGGGDGITGIRVVNGSLVVFKPHSIYLVLGYDTATFQVVEISNTLGVVSPRHFTAGDEGVYFYSMKAGLHFFNGNAVEDVFSNMRPIIDLAYVNAASPSSISLSWIGQRVWISLPYSIVTGKTVPTVNLVYDPSLKAYTQFESADSYGVVGGTDFRDSLNRNYRLLAHPNTACIVDVDDYNKATDMLVGTTQSSFASKYRTKWFDGGTYLQKKMFRRPDFVLKEPSGTIVIGVKVFHNFVESDGDERRSFDMTLTPNAAGMLWGTGVWGTGKWGGGAISSIIQKGSNLGLAKSVQLQFTGPLSAKWGLDSIGYKFQSRRITG